MRDIRRQAWLAGLCLAFLAGCGGSGSDECVPSDGFFGLGETFCPVACVSWVNLVRPGEVGTGRFALDPDYSASPPRADISVGQGFHARVLGRNLEPSGCNSFLDGPPPNRCRTPAGQNDCPNTAAAYCIPPIVNAAGASRPGCVASTSIAIGSLEPSVVCT